MIFMEKSLKWTMAENAVAWNTNLTISKEQYGLVVKLLSRVDYIIDD